MDFSNLFKNQPKVVQLLNNSHEKDRFVHTYLFSGPKGSLKMDAAYYFASLILCKNGGACGKCDDCKRLSRFVHPRLFLISPDGENIKKEQIENLEHEFSLTSDDKRVFIIKDIDKATPSASNSLLKFLESMSDDSYGVLLTENSFQVLPTIRSRSAIVQFQPMNNMVVYNHLLSNGIDETYAKIISHLTNNLSEGVCLSNNEMFPKLVNLVEDIGMSMESDNANLYLVFFEKGNFLLKADKKYHEYFLDLLINLQNDKIKYCYYLKEDIAFQYLLDTCTFRLSIDQEIKILDILLTFRQRLNTNVNIDLLYTEMFVKIENIYLREE